MATKTLRKLSLSLIALLISTQVYSGSQQPVTKWHKVSRGVKYRKYEVNTLIRNATFHVFKLNLNQVDLNYCHIDSLTNVKDAAIENHAILAINGGFFSTAYKPLGLRIQHGRIISKFKPISWWGILYIQNNAPFMTSYKNYKSGLSADFAIQAGPRLLINGYIPHLKDAYAKRTALGFGKSGYIYLVVTEHTNTSTLASFFRDKLKCTNALNLDGGSSTQLFVNVKNLDIELQGYSNLPDPICITPKTKNTAPS